MTKILITDNKIIFEGHSETKEECGVITNVVNTLAKSNNFKEIKNENGYAKFESLNNSEFKFPPMRQYSFYNHDGTQMYLSDGTYDPGNETTFTLQNATTLYGVASNGDGTMNKMDQMGDPLDNDIIISDDLTTATFPFQIAGIATEVNGDIVYRVGDSWSVTEYGETNYYIVETTIAEDNLQTKVSKLITYAKSQLSSKEVTSTATTLRGVLDDITNISSQNISAVKIKLDNSWGTHNGSNPTGMQFTKDYCTVTYQISYGAGTTITLYCPELIGVNINTLKFSYSHDAAEGDTWNNGFGVHLISGEDNIDIGLSEIATENYTTIPTLSRILADNDEIIIKSSNN